MKIAQKAFEQYRDIDPREIDIKTVTKSAVVAIAVVILLFIAFI